MRFERLNNPEKPIMRDGLDPKINNKKKPMADSPLGKLVKDYKLAEDPSEYDKPLAKEIGRTTKAFENFKEQKVLVEAAKNPIKVKDVFKNIEEKYNVKIPESIKSFMIKHSGEKPKTNNIKLGDKPYEEFNIRVFSSVDPNDKYYFFGNFVDWFFENGKKVIPIAETDGGDYFVIDITNGKVYYWYHDAAEDYYPIANSLNEFYKLTQMKEN